jgi:hypothetical protein
MMQPMQGAGRQTERDRRDRRGMTQAQCEHSLVIDRVIIALHDLGSRPGATARVVRAQLKKEGFTPAEIAEAVGKMAAVKEPKPPTR